MAYRVLVLAMLVTLHSTALIFGSMFTFKWFTDTTDGRRDVGLFGICDYLNKTTVTKLFEEQQAVNSADTQILSFKPKNNSGELILFEKKEEILSSNDLYYQRSNPSVVPNSKDQQNFRAIVPTVDLINDVTYTKCYQLLWPTKSEAFKYLSAKSFYLTVMMGVAISSASLALLTLFWSCLCILFSSVGTNLRASELLIVLSILTDISLVSTIAMFIGKDERIYAFRFYGFSFWMAVAASCGFFLTSILFTINRINIRYKYMLRNYQKKLIDAY